MIRKRRVIFRADGNSQIGLGHVVRSLALAAMLREEFECIFAIQDPTTALQEQIRQVCEGIIALPLCTPTEERFVHELDAYVSEEEIVVLDGYGFGTAYQESIKAKGAPLVCIDDIHAYKFVADVVINHAGGVSETAYETAPYTRLCLGPAHALLRPPFLAASGRDINLPEGSPRVLLNLGGADPQNLTLQLAKELRALDGALQAEIVVGAAYRHLEELQAWLRHHPGFTLHRNLDAQQMCDLMRKCGAAVASASGVAYEYAAVGGLLFVLRTADNQRDLYTYLISAGIARIYDELPQLLNSGSLPGLFREQVIVQRRHFDGQSGARLREAFRRLSLSASLWLREVAREDKPLLLAWANDPEVRRRSFNPKPITAQAHAQWFEAVLEDAQTLLYIAESDGKPAAHIRFSVSEGSASTSYLISAAFRGKGLGHSVLLKGIEKLKASRPDVQRVEGLVQPENAASVRSFEKAGFTRAAPDEKHPEALRFELRLR